MAVLTDSSNRLRPNMSMPATVQCQKRPKTSGSWLPGRPVGISVLPPSAAMEPQAQSSLMSPLAGGSRVHRLAPHDHPTILPRLGTQQPVRRSGAGSTVHVTPPSDSVAPMAGTVSVFDDPVVPAVVQRSIFWLPLLMLACGNTVWPTV